MERHAVPILWGVSAILVLFALTQASLGFFTIDEAIYLFAADFLRVKHSLILENGLDLYRSGDLDWIGLLTFGPNGLTSQYPPGTTFLWWPVVAVLGERGIILVNALATVGAVFVTHALAMKLFSDAKTALAAALIFLLATFSLEYAFGYWPHMLSVFLVAAAILAFIHALDSENKGFKAAVVSGIIVGLGTLVRIDTVLILPSIAIVTVLFANKPMRILVGGAVGLVPAMVILALVNQVKFGTLNPLSYGGKGGETSLSNYIPFLALVAVGVTGLFALRFSRAKEMDKRWVVRALLLAAVAVAVSITVVPFARTLAMQITKGFLQLVIDARAIGNHGEAIRPTPEGTKLFWGLSKKALGQSIPWVGVVAMLFSGALFARHSRAVWTVLIITAIWLFPFLTRHWHGGLAANMRYFLPVVPLLSILCAALLIELVHRSGREPRVVIVAMVLGFCATAIWAMAMPSGLAGAHQILALWVFLGVVAASLVVGIWAHQTTALVALLAVGFGLGVAVFNSFSDTAVSQLRRDLARPLTDLDQGVTGKALIYTQLFRSATLNPDQIVAVQQRKKDAPDPELVRHALADGYIVLMPEPTAEEFVEMFPQFAVDGTVNEPIPMVVVVERPTD